MSAIWDRTAQVLRGRGSMLAGIAALLGFVPAVVQGAVAAYGGRTQGAVALAGLIGLAAGLTALWSNLALVAAASDPAVDRPAAMAAGARRLPLAIGLSMLLFVAAALVALPGVAMLGARASDMAAMARAGGSAMPVAIAPGKATAAGLFALVYALAALWLGIRLSLFMPVVVNERCGFDSFARSFELTRGLTWRLLGVAILFVVLLVVAASAAKLVVALAVRLLLGAGGIATADFLSGAAAAAVTAGGTVVSATFLAQLYRVVSGREAAQTLA